MINYQVFFFHFTFWVWKDWKPIFFYKLSLALQEDRSLLCCLLQVLIREIGSYYFRCPCQIVIF